MRILFVLENYYPNIGGVETLFRHLTGQLIQAGHECVVVTSRLQENDPLVEDQPGLRIVRVPVGNRYKFTLKALRPIFRYARSCDLIQTTSYNAALPAFIGSVFFRKKVVVTFHEAWGKLWFRLPYMSTFAQWAHYAFEQMLLRLPFNLFIAVSQSTAGRLREEGVAEKRIRTIYNGVIYDDLKVAGMPEKARHFTFTYFGRLGISKGLDLLLAAAVRLKEELPDSRLQLIVPKVPEDFWAQLQAQVRESALQNYISFRHHLSFEDLKTAVAASDCVVIPSYSEGFCFAAVETVALGTPIVSSGRAALAETVSGRFVTMASFDVDGLVEAMKKASCGEWEEKPKQCFSLEDTVRLYLATYEQLLSP